jgi:hypothetical protein
MQDDINEDDYVMLIFVDILDLIQIIFFQINFVIQFVFLLMYILLKHFLQDENIYLEENHNIFLILLNLFLRQMLNLVYVDDLYVVVVKYQ